ncbi:hypothetical protein FBQ81_03295 [Chloroflexi bacterium CFX6]|nr:hypothetical protein [Chloroflexi bacterium CFX6]
MPAVHLRADIQVRVGAGQPPPSPYPAGVYRTRSYIDPVMMDLQGGVTTSNFEVVKLASFDRNGIPFFNDIAKFQTPDYAFLRSLQFEEPGYYGTIERKMNWLVNHTLSGAPTRPYWMVERAGKMELQFGTILFGNQLCQVETDGNGQPVEYVRRGQYPARANQEMITFYRVIGMRRWQMGQVTHQTHPWLIQQCTAIEGGASTDRPRGVVHYHPVWSDIDWPSNYGDGRNYVAKEFLQ